MNTSAEEPWSTGAVAWSVSALAGRAVSVSQQLGTHPVTCRAVVLITAWSVPKCSFGYAFRHPHFKSELCEFGWDEPRVSISAKRGAIPIQVHVSFILAS